MIADTFSGYSGAQLEMIAKAETAGRAIPPLWPLSSSVAVNPFLGQTDKSLPQVAALLSRVGGTAVTMPRSWYAGKIADGTITDADLAAALAQLPNGSGHGLLGTSMQVRRFGRMPPDGAPMRLGGTSRCGTSRQRSQV